MLGIWLIGMVLSLLTIVAAEAMMEDRPALYPVLGYPYSVAIMVGIVPIINMLGAIWLLCKMEECK